MTFFMKNGKFRCTVQSNLKENIPIYWIWHCWCFGFKCHLKLCRRVSMANRKLYTAKLGDWHSLGHALYSLHSLQYLPALYSVVRSGRYPLSLQKCCPHPFHSAPWNGRLCNNKSCYAMVRYIAGNTVESTQVKHRYSGYGCKELLNITN